jgi:NADH-quinone oxidoreductase subunit K
VIHLIGPAVLASALAGIGVYGLLARRNAVLVLIGAELLLNAANVLLVTASALPAGGLAALPGPGQPPSELTDPLLSGQVMAIFVITIAAAEIGVALAIVLLLFRARQTADLTAVVELGEASTGYLQTAGRQDSSAPADTDTGTGADVSTGISTGTGTGRSTGTGSGPGSTGNGTEPGVVAQRAGGAT